MSLCVCCLSIYLQANVIGQIFLLAFFLMERNETKQNLFGFTFRVPFSFAISGKCLIDRCVFIHTFMYLIANHSCFHPPKSIVYILSMHDICMTILKMKMMFGDDDDDDGGDNEDDSPPQNLLRTSRTGNHEL